MRGRPSPCIQGPLGGTQGPKVPLRTGCIAVSRSYRYSTQRYSKSKVFDQMYSNPKGIRTPKVFETQWAMFGNAVRRAGWPDACTSFMDGRILYCREYLVPRWMFPPDMRSFHHTHPHSITHNIHATLSEKTASDIVSITSRSAASLFFPPVRSHPLSMR